ncbi:MAG: PIN domain-containing protein [Caldilineaceae bacterium]|nr:PIN domain-containing protein [Caldilineaceae bacterium]
MAGPASSLRVLVDANVLVAGLGRPRWAYALLQHAVAGDFQLVLSPYVIEEARRHLARIAPDALPDFEEFLRLSNYEAAPDPTPVEAAAHVQLVRDPKDVPVAVAALQARVDVLVSHDRDLTESEALQQRLPVLLPAIFLRDLMGWTSDELEAIRARIRQELPEDNTPA